jgi:ribonuclease BN (tRNA processing enzyme)
VRVTVLGKSPSWQDAGGACSGYLVEHDGRRLLLDCGSGVFAKLRTVCAYTEIDAVLVSHMHPDHVFDLVPFACALSYGPHAGEVRPALHLPPGGRDVLRRAMIPFDGEELLEDAFACAEYDPAATLEAAGLRIAFRAVDHYVEAYAIGIEAAAGRFVFGADTGPCAALVELARGADLLLVEATLAELPPDAEEDRGHLTAREAGEHAARAGVGRLVLTHVSDEIDGAGQLRAAAEAFDGPIELAAEGAVYEI